VTEIGIGPLALKRRSLSARRLSQSLTTLVSNSEMRQTARALGERLLGRDGVTEAVRALEAVHAP
jgi:UDP:flavonoid glycosyltransferase YjiC (YdhE family)